MRRTVTGLTDTVCGPSDVESVEMLALERRVIVEREVGKVGKIFVTVKVTSGCEYVKLSVVNLGNVKLGTVRLGIDDSVVKEVTVTVVFGNVTEGRLRVVFGPDGLFNDEVLILKLLVETGGVIVKVKPGMLYDGVFILKLLVDTAGGEGIEIVNVVLLGAAGILREGRLVFTLLVETIGGETIVKVVLLGPAGMLRDAVLIFMLLVDTAGGEKMDRVVVFGPAGILRDPVLSGGFTEERLLVGNVGAEGTEIALELGPVGRLTVDVLA